jgi:hypothetical protein
VTDLPPEKPSLARSYCPGCEPDADVLLEVLEAHWCDAHVPVRAGADDGLALTRGVSYGSAEAGGDDNRRWCELIHRGTRSGPRPARKREPRVRPVVSDTSA